MKKRVTLVIVLAMVLALCLAGCETNGYMATMLVRTTVNDKYSVKFGSLEGKLNEQIKSPGSSATMKYSGKLEEGELTVYLKVDGTEKELFTISGGEEKSGSVQVGKKGWFNVIISTDGKCKKGEFHFDME